MCVCVSVCVCVRVCWCLLCVRMHVLLCRQDTDAIGKEWCWMGSRFELPRSQRDDVQELFRPWELEGLEQHKIAQTEIAEHSFESWSLTISHKCSSDPAKLERAVD